MINLANLEQNLEKIRVAPTQPTQINLTRNFHKNGKKFMPKYKNRLKLSHF
ncbi:hypothetical protein [Campylobacter concisus]|uniref:hypothetical protein n=1 Tax=Campylobacter concisus TaxID=199 RepID=UPI0015E1874B|nr:hypothetical protein [Campylobacter concisus]